MITSKIMEFKTCTILRSTGDDGNEFGASISNMKEQLGYIFLRGGIKTLDSPDKSRIGFYIGADTDTGYVENYVIAFPEIGDAPDSEDRTAEWLQCVGGCEWVCVNQNATGYRAVTGLLAEGDFSVPAGKALFVVSGDVIYDGIEAAQDAYFKPRDKETSGFGIGYVILIS